MMRYLTIGILICIELLFAVACYGQQVLGNVYLNSYDLSHLNVVVVEKSTATLYLTSVEDGIPIPIKKFQVLLGRDNGDKLREGDGRTPEGIYFITNFIPEEKLNRLLYGIGAFPLNYPNIVDRVYGKTGHGIWIHGRGTLQRSSTNGCVSLEDKDFRDFMESVGVGTPVVITGKVLWLDMNEYIKNRSRFMTHLLSFIKTWESGDIERFKGFFSEKYLNNRGETLQRMLSHRKKIFSEESIREIETSNFLILQENSKELMYQFDQLYCSDRVLDYGTKRIYLLNTPRGYKVIAEEFFPRSPQKVIQKALVEFVQAWKKAWQSQNLDEYIAFYHKEFRSARGNIEGWKKYKAGIFSRDKIISIGIDKIRVRVIRPALFKVTFVQEYMSEHHYDLGKKTLLIAGCPSSFKILRERWRKLD